MIRFAVQCFPREIRVLRTLASTIRALRRLTQGPIKTI